MFKNSKGESVPHCGDCYYGDVFKICPDNAMVDEIDDERGVLDCPAFRIINAKKPWLYKDEWNWTMEVYAERFYYPFIEECMNE